MRPPAPVDLNYALHDHEMLALSAARDLEAGIVPFTPDHQLGLGDRRLVSANGAPLIPDTDVYELPPFAAQAGAELDTLLASAADYITQHNLHNPNRNVKFVFDYRVGAFHWNTGEFLFKQKADGPGWEFEASRYDPYGNKIDFGAGYPQAAIAATRIGGLFSAFHQNVAVERKPVAQINFKPGQLRGLYCGGFAAHMKAKLKLQNYSTKDELDNIWQGFATNADGTLNEARQRAADIELVARHRPMDAPYFGRFLAAPLPAAAGVATPPAATPVPADSNSPTGAIQFAIEEFKIIYAKLKEKGANLNLVDGSLATKNMETLIDAITNLAETKLKHRLLDNLLLISEKLTKDEDKIKFVEDLNTFANTLESSPSSLLSTHAATSDTKLREMLHKVETGFSSCGLLDNEENKNLYQQAVFAVMGSSAAHTDEATLNAAITVKLATIQREITSRTTSAPSPSDATLSQTLDSLITHLKTKNSNAIIEFEDCKISGSDISRRANSTTAYAPVTDVREKIEIVQNAISFTLVEEESQANDRRLAEIRAKSRAQLDSKPNQSRSNVMTTHRFFNGGSRKKGERSVPPNITTMEQILALEIDDHNEKLSTPATVCDPKSLQYARLANMNLIGENIFRSGTSLFMTNFVNCHFDNIDLSGVENLDTAIFQNCTFNNCKFPASYERGETGFRMSQLSGKRLVWSDVAGQTKADLVQIIDSIIAKPKENLVGERLGSLNLGAFSHTKSLEKSKIIGKAKESDLMHPDYLTIHDAEIAMEEQRKVRNIIIGVAKQKSYYPQSEEIKNMAEITSIGVAQELDKKWLKKEKLPKAEEWLKEKQGPTREVFAATAKRLGYSKKHPTPTVAAPSA